MNPNIHDTFKISLGAVCFRCGGNHKIVACPQVAEVEFYEGSGKVKHIKFRSGEPREVSGARRDHRDLLQEVVD